MGFGFPADSEAVFQMLSKTLYFKILTYQKQYVYCFWYVESL